MCSTTRNFFLHTHHHHCSLGLMLVALYVCILAPFTLVNIGIKKEQLFCELSIWNLETIAFIIRAKVSNFARIAWEHFFVQNLPVCPLPLKNWRRHSMDADGVDAPLERWCHTWMCTICCICLYETRKSAKLSSMGIRLLRTMPLSAILIAIRLIFEHFLYNDI